MNTNKIQISAPNTRIDLDKEDIVFVKFNNVFINDTKLLFSSLEVYKYFETIDKIENGHVSWYTLNDFGGILLFSGTEFSYNGEIYVDSDTDYSEDQKYYFLDIYDEKLLYEEYKNIFPPMKWYNMVNPQETYFDIIVDIYKGA